MRGILLSAGFNLNRSTIAFGSLRDSAFESWKLNPNGGSGERKWQRQRLIWARRVFKHHDVSSALTLEHLAPFATAFSVMGKGVTAEENRNLCLKIRSQWRKLFRVAAGEGQLFEAIQQSYPILTDLQKGMLPDSGTRSALPRLLSFWPSASAMADTVLFPGLETFRLPAIPERPSKLDFMLATYAVPSEQPKVLPLEKLTELYHGFMGRVVDSTRTRPEQILRRYPHIARAFSFFVKHRVPVFQAIPERDVRPGKHFFKDTDWFSTLLFQPELPSVTSRGERQRRCCYTAAHHLAAALVRVGGKPNFKPQDRSNDSLSGRRYFSQHARTVPGRSFAALQTGAISQRPTKPL